MSLAAATRSKAPDDHLYLRRHAEERTLAASAEHITFAASRCEALDQEGILEILSLVAGSIDEVAIKRWLGEDLYAIRETSLRDALTALKVAVDMLTDGWSTFSPQQRQRVMDIAVRASLRAESYTAHDEPSMQRAG